ncbi:hypothetical protein C9374_005895 [Naegleria lovaniensis]|uniref:Uncharacterized protein n=1 Tax=Naegleria lovaniensis TaxID=51637 RepID=A0AA88GPB7_NAELO|nr:uncharacterized protein C9374_005895 [Naegleria lovaniensis]KAG2382103.1 hypothetical protein C9374_005895 [Naegleria lovaniensis]
MPTTPLPLRTPEMGEKRRLFSSSLSRITTQFESTLSPSDAPFTMNTTDTTREMYKKSLLNSSMSNDHSRPGNLNISGSPKRKFSISSDKNDKSSSPKHTHALGITTHTSPSRPFQKTPFERFMLLNGNEDSSGSDTSSVGSISSPVTTPRACAFDSMMTPLRICTKENAKTTIFTQFNNECIQISNKGPLLKMKFAQFKDESHQQNIVLSDVKKEIPSFLHDSYNCMDFL